MVRIFFSTLFLTACLTWAQPPQNIVTVTVDGYSYLGEDETIKTAKERAMKDAERKAVEEGSGMYIESYTKINNSMMIEDEIKTLASGYLLGKKVLVDELESNPPRYHVRIEAQVKCGDLDRLLAEKDELDNPDAAEINVDYNLVVQRKAANGRWQEIPVKNDEITNDDRLQVQILPQTDCHLYVLLFRPRSKPVILYPRSTENSTNLIRKDEQIIIPEPGQFYNLEKMTGNEHLFLIASEKSLARLDWQIEKSQNSQLEWDPRTLFKRTERITPGARPILRRRAIMNRTPGQALDRMSDPLQGRGLVIKEIKLGR